MLEIAIGTRMRSGRPGNGRARNGRALWRAAAVMAGLLTASIAGAQSATPAQSAVDPRQNQIAGASVAERLVGIARDNLVAPVSAPQLRQSAALIEAATRIDPNEPRFLRLLAEAKAQLHDVPGQIAAWSAYRKLQPDDRVAQVRLIELYAHQLQTADAQQKYLESLLGRAGIADEVKARIATEAARLLLNRSEKEASAMVDRAVKFYPLPEAVAMQYALTARKGSAPEQFKGLLAILRVDPVNAEVLQGAGDLLGKEGLCAEARPFYSGAVESLRRQGVAPTHSLLINFASDSYVGGFTDSAKSWADSVLQGQPDDIDFLFFKLTINKANGADGVSPDDVLGQARSALTSRWISVNNTILGISSPGGSSDEPVDPPDPQDAANKLAQAPASKETQKSKNDFTSVMDDMAWLELYYANKPEAAQRWIDAMQLVAPKGDPSLERLRGWYDLKTQKLQEAAKHFEANPQDVLSQLGLVQVAKLEGTPKTESEAKRIEKDLLSKHYGGLLGAIIYQSLVTGSQVVTSPDLPAPPSRSAPTTAPTTGPATQPGLEHSPDAQAMVDALSGAPSPFLNFPSEPEKFYSIHLTPLASSYRYAQPILAIVSIRNSGDLDLAIGAIGPLQPAVAFDATAMDAAGVDPSRSLDDLTDRLVLRRGDELDQIVRLDQGGLEAYLRNYLSGGLVLITGQVYTNPLIGKDGIVPGAGGQKAGVDQLIRVQTPDLTQDNPRHDFYTQLEAGAADVRIDSMDLLAAESRLLHKHTQDAQAQRLSQEFMTVIDHYTADPVPNVADWSRYLAATLSRTDGEKLIDGLMTDKEWLLRMMSVMAMRNEPFAIRRKMTATLVHDSDATVKALAVATLDRLSDAATQPASGADDSGAQATTDPDAPGAPATMPAGGQ